MAKTYVDTVKYLIKTNFEVNGLVEKPDIVGAIFGQTEGLLGDELDLRELQKNGRIGRIEVDTQTRGGKSFGSILVPSSLDMVETSILGAALEIVDRVGPCDAKINVFKIEDTRNLKRKQVLDRAKNLLKTMLSEEIPESKELSELVRDEAKISEVESYGADALPAGPALASSDSVIMVEGRADVVNLLRNGMKNVVGIGGAEVGKTIVQIGKEKEVTAFLDGDRGGDIILKELMAATDIDYVARAPPGKEVEELTRKELIKCLRRTVPVEQVEKEMQRASRTEGRPDYRGRSERFDRKDYRREDRSRRESRDRRPAYKPSPEPSPGPLPEPSTPTPVRAPVPALTEEDARTIEALKPVLKALEGSLKARFLDAGGNAVGECAIREIMGSLTEAQNVNAVVLDGIVTQRLVDLAEQKGLRYLVGIRSGNLTRRPESVKISLEQSQQS